MKEEIYSESDISRWNNPEQRRLIERAVMETIATHDDKRIGFLLWCIEGAPWEDWTKQQVIVTRRAKFFLENMPRFV